MNDGASNYLMVRIMNHFADRLPNHAIVKGGMALRLLDCPRYTNDLDYVFIPYTSKNEVKDLVVATLQEIPEITVSSSMNSKCLRCVVAYENSKVQIEINVAQDCPTVALSTALLAQASGLQGRIARVMSFEHALAHKIAAWNERNLMRDMYDIYFLIERIGVKPDIDVLNKRLSTANIRLSNKTVKKSMSLSDLSNKLIHFSENLSQTDIEAELHDYLAQEELAGLIFKFRATISRLIEYLTL